MYDTSDDKNWAYSKVGLQTDVEDDFFAGRFCRRVFIGLLHISFRYFFTKYSSQHWVYSYSPFTAVADRASCEPVVWFLRDACDGSWPGYGEALETDHDGAELHGRPQQRTSAWQQHATFHAVEVYQPVTKCVDVTEWMLGKSVKSCKKNLPAIALNME